MAKLNQVTIPAHFNIYTGKTNNRNLTIYFTEPEKGVNKNTGLLLLIPGFGGNSQSNIYKKMRLELADKYNLVVIQSDYFGSQYMQSSKRVNLSGDFSKYHRFVSDQDSKILLNEKTSFETKIKTLSKYSCLLTTSELLDEDEQSFNDMGFMQAIDLLTSISVVKLILEDNDLIYNKNKVIAYGHSHGAYLAYLTNRMAPNQFSMVIDNSAWLEPVYLTTPRCLNKTIGSMTFQVEFNYLARKLNYDKDVLKLSSLYKNFNNKAAIWSFQGVTDNLVNHKDKKAFCDNLDNVIFHLIDEKEVDNEKFFSTTHGLQADFLKLFEFVMKNSEDLAKSEINRADNETFIKSKNKTYRIDFSQGLPIMT